MRRHGFTLIEILVVMGLLGVLFGLSIGFVERAGTGNLVIQAAQSLASQLATARAQSHGSDSAHVKIESDEDGKTTLRSYRQRQVFHWPCEDFTRASEPDVMKRAGNVDMAPPGAVSSGEGRHVVFAGGRMELGNPPWLHFIDGMSVKCRVNPAAGSTSASVSLFRKGNNIDVQLVRSEPGRYDIVARLKLTPGLHDTATRYEVKTGFRDAAEVDEWKGPVLAGRWQNVTVSYDRNEFTIYVNDRLRARREDHKNAMAPETTAPFVIGQGYMGGFDSLLISGIFEDDDDRYDVPPQVKWVDLDGNPMDGKEYSVHFRNRTLDQNRHHKPVELTFKLMEGARRVVQVTLSGETFIKRAGE